MGSLQKVFSSDSELQSTLYFFYQTHGIWSYIVTPDAFRLELCTR